MNTSMQWQWKQRKHKSNKKHTRAIQLILIAYYSIEYIHTEIEQWTTFCADQCNFVMVYSTLGVRRQLLMNATLVTQSTQSRDTLRHQLTSSLTTVDVIHRCYSNVTSLTTLHRFHDMSTFMCDVVTRLPINGTTSRHLMTSSPSQLTSLHSASIITSVAKQQDNNSSSANTNITVTTSTTTATTTTRPTSTTTAAAAATTRSIREDSKSTSTQEQQTLPSNTLLTTQHTTAENTNNTDYEIVVNASVSVTDGQSNTMSTSATAPSIIISSTAKKITTSSSSTSRKSTVSSSVTSSSDYQPA